jgi:erythronate-4-phosphate dehydrogenase
MKIVVDENVPAAEALFGSLGEIIRIPGRDMHADQVKDAQALVVRSVTRVNQALLADSNVKFVGTCTIGTDHIDQLYLAERNIAFSAAPGCNARAVVQYVISALVKTKRFNKQLRCAVVGCGNVGGRLYRQLKAMGLECIAVDPFVEQVDGDPVHPLSSISSCDVICVHTPLTDDGPHPTRNLINYELLNALKPGALLLNAGRGEVINNPDLKRYLKEKPRLDVVLDVWSDEPRMDPELYSLVNFGSPHIAGYSFEGKLNGSTMIFRALCQQLNKDEQWVRAIIEEVESEFFGEAEALDNTDLESAIVAAYDLDVDNTLLGSVLEELPSSFDKLRKSYRKRREFSHYRLPNLEAGQQKLAEALGFICD